MRNLIIGILITICGYFISYGSDSLDSNRILSSVVYETNYETKGIVQLLFGIGCLMVSYIEPSIHYIDDLASYNSLKNHAYKEWEKIPPPLRNNKPPFEFDVDPPKWGERRWGYILIGTFTGIALTYTGITDLNISYNSSNKLVEIKKEIPIKRFDKSKSLMNEKQRPIFDKF